MRFPELVYQLAQSPASTGPLLELFARRVRVADTSASIPVSINGPAKDKVLVVTNIAVDFSPGAAQQIIRGVFSGRTPGGVIWSLQELGFVEVDGFRTGMSWQGEVAIGGGGVDRSIIIVDGVFDGGVQTNTVTVGVAGYVIPRGNIAPF